MKLYLVLITILSFLISCTDKEVETQPIVHCDLEYTNFEMQNGGIWTKNFIND